MSEIATEMKKLAGRVRLKNVSFLQVLMEMTLKLSPSLSSVETPPDFKSDPEAAAALLELSTALTMAFINQQTEIKNAVAVLLGQGVVQGKLGARFFRSVVKKVRR